jgi:hypothetical protein
MHAMLLIRLLAGVAALDLHGTLRSLPPMGRRPAILGLAAVLAPPFATRAHAFSPNEAIEASKEGVGCKSARCQQAAIEKLTPLLDVSSVAIRSSADPGAVERLPSVSAKQFQGLKEGTPKRIKIYMQAAERPELMWLSDKTTGAVLVARAFTPDASPFQMSEYDGT